MITAAVISFRLKALDGVSVEAEKRISILSEWGFDVHRIAGYIANPGDKDHVIPELNHLDPQVESFTTDLFRLQRGSKRLHQELDQLCLSIGGQLEAVLDDISPGICICENVFSLPLNIPFSIMLCRYLEERGIPCIAIHHEFVWQNPDYGSCMFDDIIGSHFPASLPHIRHVTINEKSREELFQRTGLAATWWRNCFDFESIRRADDFNASLRRKLGMDDQEVMFLQPTRAIERKSIGLSIKFVEEYAAAADRPAGLVVTGPCEEGYCDRFVQMCRNSSVKVLHVPNWAGFTRDDPGAESPFDIHDMYARCDMVTYPSSREGFGNPVLESVVHRKPLLVADYPVLDELRAYGFQFLFLDGMAVDRAIKLMEHPQLLDEMLERNHQIGKKHFSLAILREQMAEMVEALPVLD